MRGNMRHASWPAFFDTLCVIEHFLFNSAMAPSSNNTSVTASTVKGGMKKKLQQQRYHSQHFGLHLSQNGQCDDVILLEKVVELIEALKLYEGDDNIDYPEAADR
jgi:hypothetical protein